MKNSIESIKAIKIEKIEALKLNGGSKRIYVGNLPTP